MPPIVLASSSQYRQTLLARLGLPFTAMSPDIDETPAPDEPPEALVRRLSEQKARAIAPHHPDALIIGSDQVSVRDGQIIGKPHTHARAVMQLQACSGRTVRFLTGLCVYDATTDTARTVVEPFAVTFRDLDQDAIERYLRADMPYDCAGSFKLERRGITLFSRLHGRDPNALIGLPLIALVDLLRDAGIAIP
ncbi:MAG: nucleoside triphosphate pyrophosphatase [Myxococcota bacterium]